MVQGKYYIHTGAGIHETHRTPNTSCDVAKGSVDASPVLLPGKPSHRRPVSLNAPRARTGRATT